MYDRRTAKNIGWKENNWMDDYLSSKLNTMVRLGNRSRKFIIVNDGHFNVSDIRLMDETDFPIVFRDVVFFGTRPQRYTARMFYATEFNDMVSYIANISLTHRIMFMKNGYVYVTESMDDETNITPEVVEEFFNLCKRSLPK